MVGINNGHCITLIYAALCSDIIRINILCKRINVDQKMTDYSDTTPITAAATEGAKTVQIQLHHQIKPVQQYIKWLLIIINHHPIIGWK